MIRLKLHRAFTFGRTVKFPGFNWTTTCHAMEKTNRQPKADEVMLDRPQIGIAETSIR